MATLTFKTLQFQEHPDYVKVIFLRHFYFNISKSDLEKIGRFQLNRISNNGNNENNSNNSINSINSITFLDIPEKKLTNKFQILLEKGFSELYCTLTKNKTFYIHQNSGVPLIGTRFIGLVDKGTNILEVKPITGCTLGCTFCSVDEGIGSKKNHDFLVEQEYLIQETKKLLDFKQCKNMHIYINPHGEPLLYPKISWLVQSLAAIHWVKKIAIITNGMLLTKEMINNLADAGLTNLNISISALDVSLAKAIMGNKAYNVEHIKEMIRYAAQQTKNQIKTTIAPVWINSINDIEMEKIIAFAKEINCPVRIQKFCYNKRGRNPCKEISWDEYFAKIDMLEKKESVCLKDTSKEYILEKTRELSIPFKRRELAEARLICNGRYSSEQLCVSRDRLISLLNCKKNLSKDSDMIKIRILKTKNNIIMAEGI